MSISLRGTLVLACAAAMLPSFASAKPQCTQLFYSVNDYGKEGPSRDAQALLDKYIEKWAKEKGIKKYKTGKKDVTCELFLDVIVFRRTHLQSHGECLLDAGQRRGQEAVTR